MNTNLINIAKRCVSTSSTLNGKRNFKKFLLYNKRGTRLFKEQRLADPNRHPEIPIDKRGVRDTGRTFNGQFFEVPEQIPELIVPNLAECKFKPYVSYRAPEVFQTEFTSWDLFNAVYGDKIMADFKAKKLNDDGSPLEPSADESLTSKEAFDMARKTGSDIF